MLRRQTGEGGGNECLEERASFLGNDIGVLEIDEGKDGHRSRSPSRSMLVAVSLILCTILVFVSSRSDRLNDDKFDLFSCPLLEIQDTTNESGESFEDIYGKVSRNITTDKNEFLKTFRTEVYDGWGKPYNEVKEGMTPFKTKFFGPYLRAGMTMYESACGIGLNLFMTLEILQEAQNNDTENGFGTGITVYGNEYVKESVERTDLILGEGVIPAGNRRGVICTGDSTNLSHVPPNTFDLVYTGYITPIQDPLNIDPIDDLVKYNEICESLKNETKEDWMGQEIYSFLVKRQQDWYGKWVGEMARIAKPGAPVIVEQVSLSYCTNQNDWGGVDKNFWFEAAADNSYNWNVDPNSIQMMRDTLHLNRYHVFMLKNEG
jgi:hypothetical protein